MQNVNQFAFGRPSAASATLRTAFYCDKVVLQPTSLCNLDCRYCYLPHRRDNVVMPVAVAESVAASIAATSTPITLIWHGGEPLATPRDHFTSLLAPFAKHCDRGLARHAIQTNGTLVDDEWCNWIREHSVLVGLSLDGPTSAHSERVDWAGRSADRRILRGATLLRNHGIRFGIIAVVTRRTVGSPEKLLDFAREVGAHSIAVNFEEAEGINRRTVLDDDTVTEFWRRLFFAWRKRPDIRVREFAHSLHWMYGLCVPPPANARTTRDRIDLFPTITNAGDVVLLSPEFAGTRSEKYADFIAGNVLREPLDQILARAGQVEYVVEYRTGVQACELSCQFFGYCRGGHASNKFFEHGSPASTETVACRNSKQRLITAILEGL